MSYRYIHRVCASRTNEVCALRTQCTAHTVRIAHRGKYKKLSVFEKVVSFLQFTIGRRRGELFSLVCIRINILLALRMAAMLLFWEVLHVLAINSALHCTLLHCTLTMYCALRTVALRAVR